MRSVLKKKSFNRVLAVIMCVAMLMVSAFATVSTASAAAMQYRVTVRQEGGNVDECKVFANGSINNCYTNGDVTLSADVLPSLEGEFDVITEDEMVVRYKFDHWEITEGSYTLKDGESLKNANCTILATSDIEATAYFVPNTGEPDPIETPTKPTEDPTVPSADNKTANVKYSVEPTYTVNIPATVTLGSTSTISSEDVVVEKGKQVEVTLASTSEDDNSFKLKSAEGAKIEYTIKNNGSAVSLNDKVLIVNPDSSSTGNSTLSFVAPSDVTYSGSYTGTVTFNVAVASA